MLFFVILLVSKMFCIPNDKELYEVFPQIVVLKGFLEVNDEIIEINDESFKENIIIYLEGIYASQGTGKSVTDTAINRFVNAISKSFINMEFENITFKKKNGKIVVLSKEDIEQTLK